MNPAAATDLHPVGTVAVDIEHLAQLASMVLNEHINDNGLCTVCGCAFPCELPCWPSTTPPSCSGSTGDGERCRGR